MKLKIVIASVVSVIAFTIMACMFTKIDISYQLGGKGTSRVPSPNNITKDIEMSDKIVADGDYTVSSMSVMIGTFARKNTNENEITVYLNSKKAADKSFNSSVLTDNASFKLKDVNFNVKKGDKIEIKWVSKDGEINNSVVPYIVTGVTGSSKLYTKNLSTGITTAENGRFAINFNNSENVFDYAPVRYSNQSANLEWVCVIAVSLAIIAVLCLTLLPAEKQHKKKTTEY